MKRVYIGKIKLICIAMVLSLSGCDYLDVIPPETADIDDTMTDPDATLRFLYTCYGRIQYGNIDPISYGNIDAAGDDFVLPNLWDSWSSYAQWGQVTAYQANEWGDGYHWKKLYDGIGLCNQFMQLLDELNPPITQDTKELYKAEATFVKAYYHMRALQLYGPIPLMDELMSQNTPTDQIPGRSHFDYCVDYIVGLFDKAAETLPATWNSQYFGRGTSVIAKALKSRLLLYAASPLWNSDSSPFANWENKNFETPGYGKKLVHNSYDVTKWERARIASEDALNAALDAGFRLFTIDDSETIRRQQSINLPKVPGVDGDTPEGQEFLQRVMMFRYMITARITEGNKENIWGVMAAQEAKYGAIPHYVLTDDNGNKVGYWGGVSPTLYTIKNFYTKNGKIPVDDVNFPDATEWFKSANIPGNSDVINLHKDREARFYAWLSFDGDEYSSNMVNYGPLMIHARDPQQQGYNPSLWGNRNYSVTGYLTKKYVQPNLVYLNSGSQNFDNVKYPVALVRMAELYLNLAECQAQVGGQYIADALENLNIIRERAGIPELTQDDIALSGKTLIDQILNERFIEFFEEGQRYYDIRRYLLGPERLRSSNFEGLNAEIVAPTFEQFNRRIPINQPFTWNDRMYVLPVPTKDVYSNPQMVQAPGY